MRRRVVRGRRKGRRGLPCLSLKEKRKKKINSGRRPASIEAEKRN